VPEFVAVEKRYSDLPDVLHACAFPRWKRALVRHCFPGHRIEFVPQRRAVPAGAALILWGCSPLPPGAAADSTVIRLEEGFLHSVGLSADRVQPLSLVADRQGMYYDPTRPSDLETFLATHKFTREERARAAALRARIVEGGLTKYNVGERIWRRPQNGRRVVLVPGQVESAPMTTFGCPSAKTNVELLRAVRNLQRDAYILYKPHPAVVARLRPPGTDEHEARRWCNEVVTDAVMSDLILEVDELHVLTSLAGFEALLRGKPVSCHGQPFYAGWGLTHEYLPHARRGRHLKLDDLVAGVLIAYPLYFRQDGEGLIGPEEALDSLLAWRQRTGGREPWWRGIHRAYLRGFGGAR
jgi:capsular polysaccharide export protein